MIKGHFEKSTTCSCINHEKSFEIYVVQKYKISLLLGSQVSILEIYLPRNCLPRPQHSDIIAVGILVFCDTRQLKLF